MQNLHFKLDFSYCFFAHRMDLVNCVWCVFLVCVSALVRYMRDTWMFWLEYLFICIVSHLAVDSLTGKTLHSIYQPRIMLFP